MLLYKNEETGAFVWASDERECALLIRAAEMHDRIVLSASGFEDDATEFLQLLNDQAPADESPWPEDALCLGVSFASAWDLPYIPLPDQDPRYLASTPFSGFPVIDGSLFGLVQIREFKPPRLVFEIDIRLTARAVRRRLMPALTRAREAWVEGGGVSFQSLPKTLARCERALRLEELKRQGLSDRQIGSRPGWTRSEFGELRSLLEGIRSQAPTNPLALTTFSETSPGGMGTDTQERIGTPVPVLDPATINWMENHAEAVLEILRRQGIHPPDADE